MTYAIWVNSWKVSRQRVTAVVLAALAMTLPWSASAAGATMIPAAADAGTPPFANPPTRLGHCTALTVPVTLPNGTAAHLAGHLCTPARSRPRVVLLLLHGGTYNSSYWSWPQDPADRSFVWQALAAGYAAMVPDRLGYGRSSRPPSSEVTFSAQALTLHQVVLDLRNGRLGRYQSVIGIGHSYGSAELANQAATYPHDFAAVIMTGSGHRVSTQTTQQAATLFAPADSLLPQRFGDLDPGYLSTVNAQARLAVLYDPRYVSRTVLDYDTATQDTLPIGEARDPASRHRSGHRTVRGALDADRWRTRQPLLPRRANHSGIRPGRLFLRCCVVRQRAGRLSAVFRGGHRPRQRP
jgi:pimeloyl-ACP methyl ester carboxylesterase